jgi:hypothetical protein
MTYVDNLESLKYQKKEGNYEKATIELIELLLKIVTQESKELGYEFGILTAKSFGGQDAHRFYY